MLPRADTMARLAGELVVIVVGVLIALSADSWVAERNARIVEAARVSGLRANVDETLSRLSESRAWALRAEESLRLLASAGDVGSLPDDSTFAFGLLYGTAPFYPELNVYDDLKSSGELGLLRNTGLRQALARMEATLERVRLHQADLLSVQQLNYDGFALDELDLVSLLGPDVSVDPGPGSVRRPVDVAHVRNLAVFKLTMISGLLELYDEAAASLRGVREAMSLHE